MEFKCLMKLLIEKGYVKTTNKYPCDGESIVLQFKCEYEEVLDKLQRTFNRETNSTKAILEQIKTGEENPIHFEKINGKKFQIINKPAIKEELLNIWVSEDNFEGSISRSYFSFKIYGLDKIFRNDSDISLKRALYPYDWVILNKKEKRRIENYNMKKKQECLDFLDKLP